MQLFQKTKAPKSSTTIFENMFELIHFQWIVQYCPMLLLLKERNPSLIFSIILIINSGKCKSRYKCFFFYKHNAYKHIQPGISEKNKHMLSILSSLENNCSLLFSCLKSHLEAYSEPCQTFKMQFLLEIVNSF